VLSLGVGGLPAFGDRAAFDVAGQLGKSHVGYRNYETGDNSRNLWWVALLTYGEGWHNNHHAYRAWPAIGTAGGV